MKVLIDNNISPHIAGSIAAIAEPDGHRVVAKRDKFDPATPDAEWLRVLGDEGGWAFLSDDHRISRNPHERAAMLAAQVVGFFLEPAWRKKNVGKYEMAGRLLLWWPKLMQQCEIIGPPAAFRVPIGPGSRLRTVLLPKR